MKHTKRYPWLVVALLWFVALLNYMDRQMLSTMRDAMQIDIAELSSAERFGNLMAIFLWIYALMSPLAGSIADRVSKKWLIVGSLFVWSSVTLLMGFCTTYQQIYWLRALMGVSEALYIPAGLALIAEYHTGKSRSLAIGLHMTGLYMGQAIGGFGATVAHHFSWQSTFFSFGVIGVIYSIVLVLLLHDKDKEQVEVKEPSHSFSLASIKDFFRVFTVLLSNISFWIILFYFAAPSLPGWAIKNWLPTLFQESLGVDMSIAGPISTITIAISSFIGVIIGGTLSDKWVQKNLKGRIYTSAIGLSMTIPSLLILGLLSGEIAIFAGVLFGIGYGMFDANNMPILCQFIPSKSRATAYGILNLVGVAAGAYVTQLLGRFSDNGNLGEGFALLCGVVLLALCLQLYFLRPTTDNMD